MSGRIRDHLRSNVYGLIAVFIALGGTAYALERDSVKSKHIVDGQVKSADVADEALTADHVAPDALGGADIANTDSLGPAEIGEGSLSISGDVGGTLGDAQIAQSAVGSNEVAPDSLTAADVGGVEELVATGPVLVNDTEPGTTHVYLDLSGLLEVRGECTDDNGLVTATLRVDRDGASQWSFDADGANGDSDEVSTSPTHRVVQVGPTGDPHWNAGHFAALAPCLVANCPPVEAISGVGAAGTNLHGFDCGFAASSIG